MESKKTVIVVGRGVLALQVLRIVGSGEDTSCILANHVGIKDIGFWSRYVKKHVKIPRPDIDLAAFAKSLGELAQGKPQVTFIPVGEETLFLSKISNQILKACALQQVRILTSPNNILATLYDNYQFQKCVARIVLDESEIII